MSAEAPGTTLRQLLAAVGDHFMDLVAGSLDVAVGGLAIVDPDDELDSYPQELILVIGVRGREAIRYVRAAARGGASAVAVKAGADGNVAELRTAAEEAGIALLVVRPQVRWDQLESLAREVVDGAILAAAVRTDEGNGDLFALAQSVAVLTAGSVTIEDAENRVLAYSRTDDDVDELRRLSILQWQGPKPYMALLREWGVFQRLRSDEDVVHIEERPELGIRRRLAAGIRAGRQHLGTIWVQEGGQPFTEQAEKVLLGAARVAAIHLLRRRGSPGVRTREDLLTGLISGRIGAELVAEQLDLNPATSAIVMAFAARADERDQAEHELHRVELSKMVSIHLATYRRGALVGTLGSRIYAVLPDVSPVAPEPALITLAEAVVAVLRRRTGIRVQVGVGSPVRALDDIATSRSEADRVLAAMAHTPDRDVGTIANLRADVLLNEMLGLLEANAQLRDPAVAALVEHDGTHGTELARSLLAYLDAMGDVRAAAMALHVHPNTLRYRIRRAKAVSGINVADPVERLVCHLQLLLALRAG
ncbi:PucR family transcriptional regulator [Dactylosporangium sp. CA-233914]|uniref:PucR family transcriptional regulator n=1 Tax=Dactylosporangium sp. CA-233914 TaxID=3239934 RepID=UPI003D9217F2